MPIQEFESKHFDVTFDEGDIFSCTFDQEDDFVVSFGAGVEKEYHGPTEVVPTSEYQTLHTTNRVLTQNVVIDPIPSNYGLITWNGSVLTVS